MDSIKTKVLDFAAGRMSPQEFIRELNTTDGIYDFLQSIVTPGKLSNIPTEKNAPYNIRKILNWIMADTTCSIWFTYLNVHYEITQLLKESYPNEAFEISTSIEDRYNFYLLSIPDYIKGDEVIHFIDNIIDSFPGDLKNSKTRKECIEKLKTSFFIEGKKFPRWLRGAQWPIGNDGIPMKFVKQERIDRGCRYTFVDTKNGDNRIVEQRDYFINS